MILNNTNNDKINISNIVNNLTTTVAGKVLDARQGKILNDSIGKVDVGICNNPSSSSYAFNINISTTVQSPKGLLMFKYGLTPDNLSTISFIFNHSTTTDSNILWRFVNNSSKDITDTKNITVKYSTKNVKITGTGLGSKSQVGTWFYIIF